MNLKEQLKSYTIPDTKAEKADTFLQKVSYKSLPYKIQQHIYYGGDVAGPLSSLYYGFNYKQYWFVQAIEGALDRDTGLPLQKKFLTAQFALNPLKIEDEHYIQEASLKATREFLEHELKEAYQVDGKRTRDPHKGPQQEYWRYL